MKRHRKYIIFVHTIDTDSWSLVEEHNDWNVAADRASVFSTQRLYDDVILCESHPWTATYQKDLFQEFSFLDRSKINRPTDIVKINYDSGEVIVGDTVLWLTVSEFRLISLLDEFENEIVTKEKIISRIWPESDGPSSEFDARLEKLVSRLREKLSELSGMKFIKTHRGRGYRFKRDGFRK